MKKNPFLNAQGYGAMSADSRLYAVEGFDLEQCRAALDVPGLQKVVSTKLHRRIRKLEKDAAAMVQVEENGSDE